MKKILIAIHSGEFHADDVFAVATLELFLGKENIEVVRTRDEAIIRNADWVLDVGGVYDPKTKRFDHHQIGKPVRDNGIPYAAFGLVWKHVGGEIVDGNEIAKYIDEHFVQDIDATDNGSHAYVSYPEHAELRPTTINMLIQMFRDPWGKESNPDINFPDAVDFAKDILKRVITHSNGDIKAKKLIQSSINSFSDDIPVFKTNMPGHLFPKDTPFDIAIMPYDKITGAWKAQAIRVHPREFKTRAVFPKEWAGLRDKELQKISGAQDAVFCHLSRTMAFALSVKGARVLAKQVQKNKD